MVGHQRIIAGTVLLTLLCLMALAARPPALNAATPPTVNVRAYGALGNGIHDDTRALVRAMRVVAPLGGTVRLPRGTYRVTRITVPDGVTLAGDGMRASWIRGGVSYGSRVRMRDLKIGARGYVFRNARGARYSTFTRCRFRGGDDDTYVVVLGNMDRSCSYITFKDCKIECNLGRLNAGHSNDVNNIRISENAAPGGAHVDHVTFDGCHVGVSNGVRRGSPRAGLEAYTWSSNGTYTHEWSDLRIIDCVFEAADEFTIDLCDSYRDSELHAGPALIQGCTIKGGGRASDAHWGYSICLERPNGVVIEGNTIYRASNNTIAMTTGRLGSGFSGPIIRGNTIDLTHDNGITSRAPYIYLRGQGPRCVDNRVIARNGTIFKIENTDGVVVTGNDVTAGNATVWHVWDETVTNATLAPNTVR